MTSTVAVIDTPGAGSRNRIKCEEERSSQKGRRAQGVWENVYGAILYKFADLGRLCSCEGSEADRHGGSVENRHHRLQENAPNGPCVETDVSASDSSNAPRALCGEDGSATALTWGKGCRNVIYSELSKTHVEI